MWDVRVVKHKTLTQRALESAYDSLAISPAERKQLDTLNDKMRALIGSHIAGYEKGYKASAATKSRQKSTNTEVEIFCADTGQRIEVCNCPHCLEGRKWHLKQLKLRGYRPFGPTLGGMIWVKLAGYRHRRSHRSD